jgi:hypothetical protein
MGGPIIVWPPGTWNAFPGYFMGSHVGEGCEEAFFGFWTCNAWDGGVVCCPY